MPRRKFVHEARRLVLGGDPSQCAHDRSMDGDATRAVRRQHLVEAHDPVHLVADREVLGRALPSSSESSKFAAFGWPSRKNAVLQKPVRDRPWRPRGRRSRSNAEPGARRGGRERARRLERKRDIHLRVIRFFLCEVNKCGCPANERDAQFATATQTARKG